MKVSTTLFCSLLNHILLFSILYIPSRASDVSQVLESQNSHLWNLGPIHRHASKRRRLASRESNPVIDTDPTESFTSASLPTSTDILPGNPTATEAMQPKQSVGQSTSDDIATIRDRRLASIKNSVFDANQISHWLSTLGSDGKWPDSEIDYTTGCDARRANWPAQTHWHRIVTMSAAWCGGVPGAPAEYVNNSELRTAISNAVDYWFDHDFTNPACLDSGGTPSCPCDTPGFWNTNWYSNIILLPGLVGQTALLLGSSLTESQLDHSTKITGRAYGTFDHNVHGLGFLTGANTLDVATVGIDQGLLTTNVTLLTDAYQRVHKELSIKDAIKADGIRADGSFGQHAGILYNGNYGKVYSNDVMAIEVDAGGTQFAADQDSRDAFATLIDGDLWMIYQNVLTATMHWDFSALGRFISFPVADNQPTGSIDFNVTQLRELGEDWQSNALINASEILSHKTPDANVGAFHGSRMFYANDYYVQRGPGYVTTIKMFSTRTQNTECTNSENPLGFHLADGVVHTYLQGNEYEDIAAAWDWNLIPGITVDYGATPLDCSKTGWTGIESFVGGVSDGKIGIATMRYANPYTKKLQWQKTWFFLKDEIQHVMVSKIVSSKGSDVYSVLDQCRHTGQVFIDDSPAKPSNYTGVHSLWHGNMGYTFEESIGQYGLTLQYGKRTGNWSTIGISTQPPAVVDLFAAWIDHKSLNTPVSYTTFPGTDMETFIKKRETLRVDTVENSDNISAIFDQIHKTAMAVFWESGGGSMTFNTSGCAPITITSDGNAAVVYNMGTGVVTVSDPSQLLKQLTINLSLGQGDTPPRWGSGRKVTLNFNLPTGGKAGSSISDNVDA